MVHNRINEIRGLGQSIWLDFFDREIMDSGKLKMLIDDTGVTGVTSNPSIFEKAINGGHDFDKDITALSGSEMNNENIFWHLAVKDIQRAADLFLPVYKASKGEDGFVSIEVSPLLAYNTEGTIKQAKELWDRVKRKNVMIKIPATAEGIPAIRKCISEGININITLLFGLPRYQEVMDAYLSGLEDRLNVQKPIDQVSSVASFFLSRIDTVIDPLLDKKGLDLLEGEVAIALAKKAYQMYKNAFTSQRFMDLEKSGARRQHLLWASTSSKNPSFSDVKYVEALIGAETINTLTLETLNAFREHGTAKSSLENNMHNAEITMELLNKIGIDMDKISSNLEKEGVEKFVVAYQGIIKAIENKKNREKV